MVFLSYAEVCFGRVLRPLVTVECEFTRDLFLFSASRRVFVTRVEDILEPIFHANTAFPHKSSTAHMDSMLPGIGM